MNCIIKLGPKGVMPTRAHPSDVGFDLTLVSLKPRPMFWSPDVEVYGTDVFIQPTSDDFYFEIVPRSSIVKTQYVLANSVGIIDPSYTGELLVVLRKTDPRVESLHLPSKIAQLIPRRRIEVSFQTSEDLNETARSSGGFGSTG